MSISSIGISQHGISAETGAVTTPSSLDFWFQPPTLAPVPMQTANTNQLSFISPAQPKTPTAWWLRPVPILLTHVPTIYTAQSFVCNPSIGPPVAVDAFWTQPPTLLNHPNTLDTNQPFNSEFAGGGAGVTPNSLAFWTQAPSRIHHAVTVDTNQPIDNLFVGWTKPLTPIELGFWQQPQDLLCHAPTIDTNQDSLNFNPPLPAPPFGWRFQPNDLVHCLPSIDTNQGRDIVAPPVAATPSQLAFWAQPPDLLNHAKALDTNQPFNADFAGRAGTTPSALGFWTQPPTLVRRNSTRLSHQQFVYNPPPAPPSISWNVQPPDLLAHPATVDTNQSLDTYRIGDTPAQDMAWYKQPHAQSRRLPFIETNQGRVLVVPQVSANPSQLAFWVQPPDLSRHAASLDTNQSVVSFQARSIPTGLSFFVQPPDLSRHASSLDTNQPVLVARFMAPPSQLAFWTQPQDLLQHPAHLDTNQPRLVGQVGATPASLGFFVQPQELLCHPITVDTNQPRLRQQLGETPNLMGWWTQSPDLLRHPVTSVLGGQTAFSLNPPVVPRQPWSRGYFIG